MNKRMKSPKQGKGTFSILNVFIIILSVVLALSILITIFIVRDNSAMYYDSESSLYYNITSGEYNVLAERYYDNAVGHEDNAKIQKLSEYYAVGRYFQAAFFENAYEKAGMTEKAAALEEQMEELEPQMGQFSAEKNRILNLFN